MMTNQPLVSIITPVYNMERYIAACIESVQAQTYGHFELLLIDDCSTDHSKAIMQSYAERDPRIIILSTPVNSWAHAAGNVGLDHAKGTYIAILDSDDLITPDRLETQLHYLEANADCDVCGGWMKKFGDSNTLMNTFPRDDLSIRMGLLFDSTMGHGTAMIRRDVIERAHIRYNTDIYYTHDYHFFTQLAFDAGARFASIPHLLYLYRWHAQQTSVARRTEQIGFSDRVRAEVAARFDLTDPDLLAIHLNICKKQAYNIKASHAEIMRYYDALVTGNRAHQHFPEDAFETYLADRLMRGMARRGIDGLRFYLAFPYRDKLSWGVMETLMFIFKSILPARRRSLR